MIFGPNGTQTKFKEGTLFVPKPQKHVHFDVSVFSCPLAILFKKKHGPQSKLQTKC